MAEELPLPAVSPVAALTRRLAAGEEAAFAEFHAAWAARLFRYVRTLLRGDEHAARDVWQETLVRVVRHARPLPDERALWDWLARLARCAAADHGRKGSRYRRLLARFGAEGAEAPAPDTRRLAQAVEAALATLPAGDADLLRDKYERDQSQRELAERLAVSEAAVESRLRRARRALRERAFAIFRQDPS